MTNSGTFKPEIYLLNRHMFSLFVIWTVVVIGSLGWNIHQLKRSILDVARNSAKISSDKDLVYRRWVSNQGGVYVPVSVMTPPNPFLTVSNRDITTTQGISLTLVNPAYMTRQVNEMAMEMSDDFGHLTSLNPLRPENHPDPWETEALKSFERGTKDAGAIGMLSGREYFRFMRPFITEKSCLKCHAAQGYKEGDTRGGIGISISMKPLRTIEKSRIIELTIAYSLLWMIGLLGIGAGTRRLWGQMLLQEKLEIQNRQLQKNESLSRMAGAIAHHFNNQLMAVMGNLELAMGDLSKGAEPIETLRTAMDSAIKAAEVSSLMLTYLGQTPTDNISLDLAAACRENLPLLNGGLPKNVFLETSLPNPGPTINANSKQIQQILANLFENAWEAMGVAGGTIRLNVTTVSPVDISSAFRLPAAWQPKAKAYACLKVADTGVGITNQDLGNIFDPFFSTKFVGRGLGLAVVAGIVKAHEGVVTVESVPGLGSTFCVYLPLSSQAKPAPAKPSVEIVKLETLPASYTQSGTVLLIEDDESVRKVAKRLIEHCGFSVLTAGDGAEGLEVFRQHQAEICCVLTDLTMPRMDGWATLTALRTLRPGLPVIMTSGYAEAEVMAGDHSEKPQSFLSKPYQLNALRVAIGKALAAIV